MDKVNIAPRHALSASNRPAIITTHEVVYVVAIRVKNPLDIFLLKVLRLQDGQRVSKPARFLEIALDFVEL